MVIKLLLIFFLALSSLAYADAGLPTFIRQARMTAMGGAAIGLADDEYALINNPAGLAGLDGRRFKVLGLSLEGSYDIYGTFGTSLDAVKNFSTEDLNLLMGKDIYLRMSNATIITLPHFAIGYLVDAQGSIQQFNPANPTFKVGNMITHGIQVGTGHTFKSGRRAVDEFRVGAAGKLLWRRGGYYDVGTTGFLQATQEGKAYIDNLVGSYGMGIGVDLGVQYVRHVNKRTQLSAGAVFTDIGGTRFSVPNAQDIDGSLGFGLGFSQDLNFFKLKFAADLKHLEKDGSFSNKTHLGTQLSIPLFDFYLGLNQLNLSFGFAFDIWLLKVSAFSYAEELGYYYHQHSSRRYGVQIDLNLPI